MNTTRTNGAVNYKKLLLECKELKTQGRKGLYGLTNRLVKVFSDDAFRQDIGATDDFAVVEALDEYVSDTRLSFLELRTLLAEFPAESEWLEAKSITAMYDEACQRINDRKPETEDRPVIQRNRITREVHEKVVNELQDRNARLQFVEKQAAQSVATVDQLQAALREKDFEIERLKGRIEELERMVKRELQSA